MALSWNEIKIRAIEFSKEWENDFNEHAEAKSFMDAFFNVFGIARRRVATFEQTVKKEDGRQGFIDLLWKGVILIEFKSRGKNLDKAHTQAKDYFPGIKDGDLPKYILVCDFERFRLYDLEEEQPPRRSGTPPLKVGEQEKKDGEQENKNSPPAKEGWRDSDGVVEFNLSDLVQNVQHFGYLLGYQKKVYQEQDPANIKAAELMGKLHDRLEEIGYREHPLEVYLVRILFCLFAEDTTIFNKQQFQDFIEQRTCEDGSDLAAKLQELFQVLNTSKENRFKNLDEQLADFPYVNGKLFEEILPTASFDSKMRQSLLDCCYLDWSKISPAIFGSMFQSVMNPKERRNLGAHYTSETNILKLIKPLFLDDLWKEFENIKDNRHKLQDFHQRLSKLKFLDPACGCGNFLVITYRELRLLEVAILKALRKSGQAFLNVSDIIWLDVDMMCGIEFEEFPARIAEVAMWLIDHQMNMQISNEFGNYFVRLPLKKSAKIVHGNALQIDWETVVAKDELSFILGNPPFLGKKEQNPQQKADMERLFANVKGSGVLDYVTAWYLKAAQFLSEPFAVANGLSLKEGNSVSQFQPPATAGGSDRKEENSVSQLQPPATAGGSDRIKVAFVSTNSISQGEQVGILWNLLFSQYNIKIHFAHRTFRWNNEAKGNAAVHCVIIGFASYDTANKTIYEYENIKGEAHEVKATNINPYLVDSKDLIISSRNKPISNVENIVFGNMPNDGGHLLLSEEEKTELLQKEPNAERFIRKFLGSEEYINNKSRYCLWLKDASPSELRTMPIVLERVENVRKHRNESSREATRKLANYPTLFGEIRQPNQSYVLIPSVSSERRKFVPMGFMPKEVIASNLCLMIPNATLYLFGVLTSTMHMTWMRQVCGRLESRYRYSNNLVYNNYPFPENPTEKQIKTIETAAQRVLDARLEFPNSSLADLYDPLTMPPVLVRAHNDLDKFVDLAYRPQVFTSEANRMVFLFELYEKYTANLFTEPKKKKIK